MFFLTQYRNCNSPKIAGCFLTASRTKLNHTRKGLKGITSEGIFENEQEVS
jgi:hypothetical protein